MDKYTKKYIRLIKQVKTDQELSDIIDKIYTDGFDDGEQTYTTSKEKTITEIKNKYHKEFHDLIENMESDGLAFNTIASILKQESKGYI